jgi:hypothetical protein
MDILREQAKAMDDNELIRRLRDIRARRNVKVSKAKPENTEKKKDKLRKAVAGMSKADLIAVLKGLR